MPDDLSYGYKKPRAGEPGRIFFVTLEENWSRISEHNHDGSSSAKISSASIKGEQNTVSASNWQVVDGQKGTFRQLVQVPTGMEYAKVAITFYKNAADFSQLMLSTERVPGSTTQYYVYSNDNTLNLVAVYST
jgi:hypothetical protein